MVLGNAVRKRIVAEVLAERGWTLTHASAIAKNTYATATGAKDALAYLSTGDLFNVTLSGECWSEGSNCLGAAGVLIPLVASETDVRALALKFDDQVNWWVSRTYAVRLLTQQKETA